MLKKILFALVLLFISITSGLLYSSGASALELNSDSEIYKKIIRQSIKACYREEPLSSKVFVEEWPNNEFYGLFGDALWVSMPTGYTLLEDNFVTCKGLIYGDKIGSGAKGEYAGILDLYGKDISDKTGLEKKKELAVGLGYEEAPEVPYNKNAPLYYALKYTYMSYHKTTTFVFLKDESTRGPYDAATYVTGTKVNEDGTVAGSLEIFASGNGATIEDAGIIFKENTDKTGGTLSIACTDFVKKWKEGLLNDILLGMATTATYTDFDCVDGDLPISYNQTIWNDGDIDNGANASGNSIIGFLNKHLPLDFSTHMSQCRGGNMCPVVYEETNVFTAAGTISNDPYYVDKPTNIALPGEYRKIGSWDDRAVKGMEYFTGGTNRIFTDAEIYILYAGYLTDYYKADFQCGADKAEYYAGREGYIRASNLLYDGEMRDECYVKAVENADKKVNGVSFYSFNGADRGGGMVFYGQKTFEELLDQVADLNVDPESIAEANIAATKTDDAQSEPDLCYGNSGSLGWIVCPVIIRLSDTLNTVYKDMVEPFLVIDADLLKENVSYGESATHRVWEVFRNISNIIFVILFMIVVFSQLTGVGIDNYGVKKILPKLIVAAILINLSYYICQIAVDVSNILGKGLNDVFTEIAKGIPSSFSGDFNSGNWFAGVLNGALAVLGIGTTVGLVATVMDGGISAIILPLLMGLITAFVAVIFFFILLGMRKAGVIIFVALSPLAFACYMLPNTKKLFDKWLKGFEGLLLVYPISGALIGGSVLVSRVLIQTDDFLVYLIGLLLLVVPFFFVPVLLKGSFAAMGNIGAKISGFGKLLGSRSGGRLNRLIRNSERFKNHQAEIARRNQERNANSTIRRLNSKMGRRGGRLNERDTRRLARSQESLDRLQREDKAARTILSEREFRDSTMPELEEAWNDAFDNGDSERLDALTNVLNTKYGSAGAKFIGDALAGKTIVDKNGQVNQNAVASLRMLQDNMNHNSSFATSMRSKASDAYGMISNAGMYHNSATGKNEYKNLSHFSANNNISTDLKDWSTQSASTLQRAVNSGALDDDMVEKLLTSTDPAIQSGIQSDTKKMDVLRMAKRQAEAKQAAESARQQESLRVQTDISKSLQNIDGTLNSRGGNSFTGANDEISIPHIDQNIGGPDGADDVPE